MSDAILMFMSACVRCIPCTLLRHARVHAWEMHEWMMHQVLMHVLLVHLMVIVIYLFIHNDTMYTCIYPV